MIRKFLKTILLVDILKALFLGLRVAFKKPVTRDIDKINRPKNFRRHFSINCDKCVCCRLCMQICPCAAIKIVSPNDYEFDKHRCSYCGLCEKACPKQAIEFKNKADSDE